MTTNTSRSAVVAGIREQLCTLIQVAWVESAEKLACPREGVGVAGLVDAVVRFDHHFDLSCDLLLHDRELGSLGIVHILDGAEDPVADVRQRVEGAAYLRHLAQTKAARANGCSSMQAVTVEIVLATKLDRAADVANALRRAFRDGDYLHGVGVHLLRQEEDEREWARAVRRAFCWLLPTVRDWFGCSIETKDTFGGIEVADWRVPGRRRLELQGDSVIHVVHGANGSGKSSLVEAIELLATGHIERLGHELHFVEHVRNGSIQARNPAEARLLPPFEAYWNSRQGNPPPGLGLFPAGAFRLDQVLMDRLALADDATRADHFLGTFFRDHKDKSDRFRTVRMYAEERLNELPGVVRAELPLEPEARALAWTAELEVSVRRLLRACLPVPVEQLEIFVPFAPGLRRTLDSLPTGAMAATEVAGWLESFDMELASLERDLKTIRIQLAEARRVLEQPALAAWTPETGMAAVATPEALNEWLRAATATAIARQQLRILRVIHRSEMVEGKRVEAPGPGGFNHIASLDSKEADALGAQLKKWEEAEQVARGRIAGLGRRARMKGEDVAQLLSRPTDSQIAALDAVSAYLSLGERPKEGLGRALDRAIAKNEAIGIGRDTIGAEGWTERLLERIAVLENAVEAWERVPPTDRLPGNVWRRIQAAHAALVAREEAGREVAASLVTYLLGPEDGNAEGPTPLFLALDELTALFTPARFAYPTVGIVKRVGTNGLMELTMSFGSTDRGQLRLNTAELNAVVVALFLLCAPKVANPLRLLVLDDPLQNMDELTVTVLARGLSKIARLLDRSWRILIFVHGEDDFERVQMEIPCTAYRLPWLTPSTTATAKLDIESIGSRGTIMQDLSSLQMTTPPAIR